MTNGTMTFSEYPPEQVDQVLTALPTNELEAATVPTLVWAQWSCQPLQQASGGEA